MPPHNRTLRLPLFIAACALALPTLTASALPAFPGAEGFGANATGGRGGDVYHVTSLADANTPGTLRYRISSAPSTGRTIVFDVSGTIALNSNLSVNKPKITIAGQTAPGQGILFKDYTFNVNASDVVVRYIHSRLGIAKRQESDTIDITGGTNVILDHVSASWSVDELHRLRHRNHRPPRTGDDRLRDTRPDRDNGTPPPPNLINPG